MSLSRDLKEWKERFNSLLAEGQELLKKIEERERQSCVLQESFTTAQAGSGGLEALRKLYDDGFHICHARFGQIREEECLFCVSFLQDEGIDKHKF